MSLKDNIQKANSLLSLLTVRLFLLRKPCVQHGVNRNAALDVRGEQIR